MTPRQIEEPINLYQFENLKNNNDWSEAIIAAIAATPKGGILKFPAGRYEHSGIVINKPINIIGSGKYATVLVNKSSIAPAVTILSNVERGTFKDIGIFGDGTTVYGTNARSGKGIVFNNNSVCWNFENIWMRGHGDWFIYAEGTGSVNNINIINSELEWGKKGAIHFIQQDTSNQINAIRIDKCNISGFEETGIEIWGQSISVENCTIQACKKYGVAVDGSIGSFGSSHARGINILNNYFEGCNKGFIYIKASTSYYPRYISNLNVIGNFGTYGIIANTDYDPSETYCMTVEAPDIYSYAHNQVSSLVYMSNSFDIGGVAKGVINANNILSYDSIVQTSIVAGYTRAKEMQFAGLGRAKKLTDTTKRKTIKGISSCLNHLYNLQHSESIIDNKVLQFDFLSFLQGCFKGINFFIETDCKDYTIKLYFSYRDHLSTGTYSRHNYHTSNNISGSKFLTWSFDTPNRTDYFNTNDGYFEIDIVFNSPVTYMYLSDFQIDYYN